MEDTSCTCFKKIVGYAFSVLVIILAIVSVIYTYSLFYGINQTEGWENVYVEDTFSAPIDDISELLNQRLIGFVYVGRDSCAECLTFNWIMREKVLPQYPELHIRKFDTSVWKDHEGYEDVLEMYGIDSIPTLILFQENGTCETYEMEGLNGQEILELVVSLIEQK